jgi:nitrate reductase NapE component
LNNERHIDMQKSKPDWSSHKLNMKMSERNEWLFCAVIAVFLFSLCAIAYWF